MKDMSGIKGVSFAPSGLEIIWGLLAPRAALVTNTRSALGLIMLAFQAKLSMPPPSREGPFRARDNLRAPCTQGGARDKHSLCPGLGFCRPYRALEGTSGILPLELSKNVQTPDGLKGHNNPAQGKRGPTATASPWVPELRGEGALKERDRRRTVTAHFR